MCDRVEEVTLVSGLEVELGYFSFKELQDTRGPLGLPIERGQHFKPKTFARDDRSGNASGTGKVLAG